MRLVDCALNETNDLAKMGFDPGLRLLLFRGTKLLQKNGNLRLVKHRISPSVDEL
ncbi:hypothetical protein [Ottowia sp.]|uniref:hypothetical protein n=1 Tax=Ottowia sp. TaxID=1898956 RepID=UPI0026266CD4|nr:hypothetical protein [Ottowia sp.]